MQKIFQLSEDSLWFPKPEHGPGDLPIAIGGDLSAERLNEAYKSGIFPWFNQGDEIMWWSPDPRMVLYPEELKISKSMRTVLRNKPWTFTHNKDFAAVIENCGRIPRKGQEDTWITPEMKQAYLKLNQMGVAHSFEAWEGKELIGGFYGVLIGKVFFGESMFARVSNASKAIFIHAMKWMDHLGLTLVDCQVYTDHLSSLGAREISRNDFLQKMRHGIQLPAIPDAKFVHFPLHHS